MRLSSLLLGLLLVPLPLRAGEDRIQVQWTLVSSAKPLIPEAPNADVHPPVISLMGVLDAKQTDEMLGKAKADSATIAPLKPALTSSGKVAETENLREISITPRLIGDTKQYPVGKIPEQTERKCEVGYSLKCTPAGKSPNPDLDLSLAISLVYLKGYNDTFLNGAAGMMTKDPKDVISDIYPRLRGPIIQRVGVTTNITIWSGHSVLLKITDEKETGSYDYLMVQAAWSDANAKP